MRPNTLFLVAGVLALAFGLGFLLVPAAVLPLYGVQPEAATVLMSRFFGVALVQLGLVLILIRQVREPGAVRGLALAGVLGSVCGALVALLGGHESRHQCARVVDGRDLWSAAGGLCRVSTGAASSGLAHPCTPASVRLRLRVASVHGTTPNATALG